MRNRALSGLFAYTSSTFPLLAIEYYRKHVVFGVQKGISVSCIDETYLSGTVAAFFGCIKLDNLLSETDVKNHKLQLRLFVYPHDSQYVEVVCPT